MQALTVLAYVLHVTGGAIALVSGYIALFAPKGGRLHRAAGTIFFISMLVMAAFAAYLGLVVPGQLVNVFIAAFALYFVITSWLAAKRTASGKPALGDRLALIASLIIFVPFGIIVFEKVMGLPLLFKSAVPIEGPVLIALYSFTGMLAIAVIGDARAAFGRLTTTERVGRHLWRMCVGLTMATGSAFTNGFARLLPGPYHVPPAFFYPQFVPLILLLYWMIRIRFPGWWSAGAGARSARPATSGPTHN
jgi:Predicted membrane protein (DUF2306)